MTTEATSLAGAFSGQRAGVQDLLRFLEDGVVLRIEVPLPVRDRDLAAWAALLEPGQARAETGRYVRRGSALSLTFRRRVVSHNYDWDDKQYQEEGELVLECSGSCDEDRLTLDWSSRWESDDGVPGPGLASGQVVFLRLGAGTERPGAGARRRELLRKVAEAAGLGSCEENTPLSELGATLPRMMYVVALLQTGLGVQLPFAELTRIHTVGQLVDLLEKAGQRRA